MSDHSPLFAERTLFDVAALRARPSPETSAFNARLAKIMAALPDPWTVDVNEARALRAAGKGAIPIEGPRDEAVWVEGVGGRRLRYVSAEAVAGQAPRGLYLHIHGGGWTFGAPDQFDGRNIGICHAAGVDVLSVEYRLAPEHPWPACRDDAVAGAEAAAARASEAGALPIIVGGESAGAHLAALVALGDAAPIAGAVLNQGCFDLRMTPSMRLWGAEKLVLSTPVVDWFVSNLLGERRALADTAEVSPIFADLNDPPPVLFQIGTCDPLLDDTLLMASRWAAAGGAVETAVWPGGAHAFDNFIRDEDNLPIAHASRALEASWIDRRLTALGR